QAQKPKPGCSIALSPLRPDVPAAQRLVLWCTPYNIKQQSRFASSLSSKHLFTLFSCLLSSVERKMRSNYGAGLLRFNQFCDSLHIPESTRMPVSDYLLAALLAEWQSRTVRYTVDTWLADLHFWHTIHGAPWLGGDMVKTACKAISKAVPAISHRPKRPPVTLEHMHALRNGLDLSNTFDVAVYACACMAFWSVCHLGEVVVPSATSFDPEQHMSRERQLLIHPLPGGSHYATLHIL
ncbi:uncharacterized protein LAESUDRAFT_643395, partial [Laetiporus sulphureus 93-53]